MTKAGKKLIGAAREIREYASGKTKGHVIHVPDVVDVKLIRSKLALTQAAFADSFGFKLDTVKDWEQGRRSPERTARILLKVIERSPKAVQQALAH